MNSSGSFSKTNQILGMTCVLFAMAATQGVAQSVTLAIGSGSAAPGAIVTLPLTISASGSAQPSDLEWTMAYSSSDISNVSVAAGASAIAASKIATCSSIAGSTRCVITGANSNVIGNGTLATVAFTVASGSVHTSTPIPLSGVVVSGGSGSSIAGSGVAGTITINQPVQPTLTGLTCAPANVNPAGVSACTVTLNSAALTGGFAVALSSNNALLTVPGSVTVAAGALSAGFSASVAATVPTSQTAVVTASAASVVKTFSLNIAASAYTITGSVGTLGSGATIALSGASTATTTANVSGAYTFSGLANGSYTITPSLTGFTFSPTSVAVTVNGANVTAGSFTPTAQTWTITGGVGTSGSGATIALTGTSTATTTANSSGAYTFSGLANGFYTITPSLSGFTFSPTSVAVTVSGANVTAASFTATAQTWTITGGVGAPGSGATIALTGTSTATTTANASGAYTFSGLANGSYTITPSLTGFSFSPASVAVTVNGANVTAGSFTATAQTWTITGGVGTAGSGATIALTGTSTATTTANASGAYTFSGLANGTYTITPSLSGYTFTPASVAVTVNGANLTAPSFTEQGTSLGPITFDAAASTDQSTQSTSISVPAFSTASSNELLLAFIATGDRTRILTSPTVTGISGGGLTWVLITRTDAQKGDAEIWRAFAATPLTGVSIKATLSQSVPASMTLMSFKGINTTGTNGSGAIGVTGSGNAASGAPSATLTTTHSGSMIIGVGSDTKAGLARTVGPGQTLVHQYLASTSETYWVQALSTATASSGASITINDSAPTSDPYNLSIVEILPGQSSGTQMTGVVAPAAVTAKAANSTNNVAPAASLALAIITTGEVGQACSPGGLASLLGAGLTGGQTGSSTAQPLPTQLAGVQVMINGVAAPLLLASNSQINFQCPVLPQGTAMEVQVESANGAAISSVQTVMQAAVPLVFQLDASGRGFVTIGGTNEIATTTTSTIPSRPARRGEVVTVHASGLGEVLNGVDAGTAAPTNRPVPTKAQIKLVLGGVEIDPEFAGLTAGTVGLYQVNALVPANTAAGSAVPLYLKMTMPDGSIVRSNTVNIAITDASGE